MKVSAMATREGNTLVERIVDAAARLHVVQGATREEALQFMEKSMVTLSCANEFIEADSTRVRMDACHRFTKLVEQFEVELENS